ncbi:MAG: TetR/AcrR family transcriptional regulator [Cyanobacteria bacterium J06554_6]
MPQTKTYHHGDLRQALITAALSLMAETEVGSLSLREVARRAGVSHTAPYRHFADKEALLAAVAEAGFRAFGQCLEAAAMTTDDPLKRLTVIGQAYVRYALAHPVHYRVMFGSYDITDSDHPTLIEAAQRSYQVLLNAIVSGQSAGAIRPGEPQLLATTAWSLTHGLAMLLLENCLTQTLASDPEALTGAVSDLLISGLAAPQT